MKTKEVSKPNTRGTTKSDNTHLSMDRCADNENLAWLFQVDSAILLALAYLKDIEKVNIEGLHEDIEVHNQTGGIGYYQAKLKISPGLPAQKERAQYNSSMREKIRNTLAGFITTLTKIEKEHTQCTRLVFLTNALYPLGLFNDAKWEDFEIRKYSNLSGAAQEVLHELAEKKNFPLERIQDLWICVVPYERNDEEEQPICKPLKDNASKFLGELLDKDWQWESYLDHLRSKAVVKSTCRKYNLTKKDIIWYAIVMNMDFSHKDYASHFKKLYDKRRAEKLERRYANVISYAENRLDLMMNIIGKYKDCENKELEREESIFEFAKSNTTLVKDVLSGIPDGLTEDLYDSLCVHIIYNMLLRDDVIFKAKKKYNLL